MEENYLLVLAIYDFLPVIFFFVGGLYLAKIALMTLDNYMSVIFITGVLLIFLGGASKAAWKLLFVSHIADIHWMSELQFIFMSIGYLATLIPLLNLVRSQNKNKKFPLYSIAIWKIPFLIIMTLACLGTYATLAVISFRRQLRLTAIGFVISIIGVILLGFLASRSQTLSLQWIEQSINSLTNLSFALSSILLYKNYKLSITQILVRKAQLKRIN